MPGRMRLIKSEIYFPIIIGLHLVLWSVDLLIYDGPLALAEGENPIQRVLGEVMSSWVITVFGFNLLMVTRARWVERIFGGLDKMYLIHRRSGVIAMVLLFLHFGIVPRHPEFSIGKPLGFVAMLLILVGIVLTVAPVFKRRIPYGKWLSIHRLMGPFYIIGVLHAATVPTLISHLPLIRTYVFGMAFMGVAAWVYRVFLHRLVHPSRGYKVSAVERLGGSVVSMEMVPEDRAISFAPGQFGFFGFPEVNPRESHPFTVASHPEQQSLRIAIKASGDLTEALQNRVKIGDPVRVEGPYGRFTQSSATSRRQIWIAGGIGITPFLSMARDLSGGDREIFLYWTVRTKEEAHFDRELRELADGIAGFSYRLWESNTMGRLTTAVIPEAGNPEDLDLFICGPEALRNSITDQLRKTGVPQNKIHSEEFAFR